MSASFFLIKYEIIAPLIVFPILITDYKLEQKSCYNNKVQIYQVLVQILNPVAHQPLLTPHKNVTVSVGFPETFHLSFDFHSPTCAPDAFCGLPCGIGPVFPLGIPSGAHAHVRLLVNLTRIRFHRRGNALFRPVVVRQPNREVAGWME